MLFVLAKLLLAIPGFRAEKKARAVRAKLRRNLFSLKRDLIRQWSKITTAEGAEYLVSTLDIPRI